jgi:hypothetical protein
VCVCECVCVREGVCVRERVGVCMCEGVFGKGRNSNGVVSSGPNVEKKFRS